MKKISFTILSGVLFVVLSASCASSPRTVTEPGAKYSNLVVGSVVMHVKNMLNYAGLGVSNEIRSGLTLVFYNISQKKTYEVSTYGNKGLFYAAYLPAGKYAIVQIIYKLVTQNGRTEIGGGQEQFGVFEIQDGKVNNVGNIDWLLTGGEQQIDSTNRRATIEIDSSMNWTSDHDNVQELFAKVYPKSEWIGWDWQSVDMPEVKK